MNENNFVPGPVAKMHEAIQTGFDTLRNLTGRQIAAITLAGGMALSACSAETAANPELPSMSSKTDTTETTATAAPEVCATSWVMVEIDPGAEGRLMADGLPEIRDAVTPEDARHAANVMVGLIKTDDELLAGFSKSVLKIDASPAELTGADGCATPRATELATALEATLALSEVTVDEAPANGFNSGTDAEGNVAVSETTGITGDRKALKFVTVDGETFWVMARCTNLVFPGHETPPALPITPRTDNPTTPQGPQNKNPNLDYNNNTGPNNGPGSGGQPGPEGTTSTTAAPATIPNTTTTRLGGSTTTAVPVPSTVPASSTTIPG